MLYIMGRNSAIIKKIEFELSEYHYPQHNCSAIILPDGRMFGIPGILKHKDLLEKIIGEKVIDGAMQVEWFEKLELVSIEVNKNFLFITIAVLPSSKQKETINDLINYGKYEYMTLDSYDLFIESLPNKNDLEKMFPNNYCDKGWGRD